jgi:hypothetical protein
MLALHHMLASSAGTGRCQHGVTLHHHTLASSTGAGAALGRRLVGTSPLAHESTGAGTGSSSGSQLPRVSSATAVPRIAELSRSTNVMSTTASASLQEGHLRLHSTLSRVSRRFLSKVRPSTPSSSKHD